MLDASETGAGHAWGACEHNFEAEVYRMMCSLDQKSWTFQLNNSEGNMDSCVFKNIKCTLLNPAPNKLYP